MSVLEARTPTLGPRIRAARLGWGFSRRHGAFIRMSDAEDGNFRIELCPARRVPSGKTKGGFHRVWWDTPELLDLIPWFKGITSIKRYVCVVVNEHGGILRSEA